MVYGLDDAITILKATYVMGDCGAAEATWLTWRTGVRARIQPVRSSVVAQHEARQTSSRFQIFVEGEFALDQTHRILAADGTIYKILGVTGASAWENCKPSRRKQRPGRNRPRGPRTMNLDQVIHQRWAATPALDGLLPAERVYTGMSVDPTLPYAVLSKESERPGDYHNDGSATAAVGLRIQVFAGQYRSGADILHQLKAAFDHGDFPLSGADKVVDMQRLNDFGRQSDDGVWQFTCDFLCTVYLAAGV